MLHCEVWKVAESCSTELASCLIYARALLEYVIFIVWLPSVIKMLQSVKFAEDKVLTCFPSRSWYSFTDPGEMEG